MLSLRRTSIQRLDLARSNGRAMVDRLIALRREHPDLADLRPSDPRVITMLGELRDLGSSLDDLGAQLAASASDLGVEVSELAELAELGALGELGAVVDAGLAGLAGVTAEAPPGASAAAGALMKLGNALGLARSTDDELDYLFADLSARRNAEHELVVAEATRELRDEILAEIGAAMNATEVQIELDADLQGLLGRSQPGVVQLGPRFDPFTREGKALLTHELVHELQRRVPGVGDVMAAEEEAETIMHDVMRGGPAYAPGVPLPGDVDAGCGPQAMAEKEEEKCEGPKCEKCKGAGCKPEPVKCVGSDCPPPPPPSSCVGPNCPPPPPPGKVIPEPDKPKPVTVPTFTIPVEKNDCAEPCPDPIAENKLPPMPKAPPPAPKGEGEARTLTIAGHTINFRLPSTASAGRVTVHFRASDTPFANVLTLKTAALTLGDDLKIKSGQLFCGVKLGKFLKVPNAMLHIGQHGAVAAEIRNASIQVGPAAGKIDLSIGADGIQGNGTFQFSAFKVGKGITFKSGSAQVALDKGGSVSAHGAFEVDFGEHVTAKLDLCFVDGELRGALTAEVHDIEIPVGPGVCITRIQAGGCLSKTGMSLHGEFELRGEDWLQGTYKGDYKKAFGQKADWSLEGDLETIRTFEPVKGVLIEQAKLHGKLANGKLEPLEGELHVRTENVMGTLTGSYDFAKKQLDGKGEVDVVGAIDAGPFQIEEGQLVATIADGKLTEITGHMKVALTMDGKPTFEVDCEQAAYIIATKELHAVGSLNVVRDVTLGTEAALHAKIPACQAGMFAVENGTLMTAGAKLQVTVAHGANPVGHGAVGFSYAPDSGMAGELEFSLDGRSGLPSFESGPLFLLPGGYFKAVVAKSALADVHADSVQWELVNPTGAGKVMGQVSGAYDFGTGQASLEGMAFVQEPWVQALPFGTLTFQSGDGSVKVTNAGVERLEAKDFALQLMAETAAGSFVLDGHASGALNPETGAFDGTFSAKLSDGQLALPAIGPLQLFVNGGSEMSGTLAAGSLVGPLTGALQVDLKKDGADFLTGGISDATFDLAAGKVSGEAAVGLAAEKDLAELGVPLPAAVGGRLLPGTGISATIVGNEPQRLGGTVLAMFSLGGEDVMQGDLTLDWDLGSGAITGDIYGNLLGDIPLTASRGDDPKAWGVALAGGSQMLVKLGPSGPELAEVDVTANLLQGAAVVAKAEVSGHWLFGEAESLDGQASVTLVQDLPLARPGRFESLIGAETTAELTIAASEPESGTVHFVLGLDEAGARKADLTLDAQLGDTVSGQAELSVHENIALGLGQLHGTQFGVDISTETHALIEVVDSQPTTTVGDLVLEVTGNGTPFAKGTFHVDADLSAEQSPVNADGEVTVTQRFPIGDTTDFTLSLAEGTTGRANIVASALADLDGSLGLVLEHHAQGEVGKMTISGQYHGGEKPILNGSARVDIEHGFTIIDDDAYGFGFAPSSFQAIVSNGDISMVTGSFGLWGEQRGDDQSAPLGSIEVAMSGTFARAPGARSGSVTGSGELQVHGDFKVAQAGNFELVVSEGTAASVTIVNNKPVKVDGALVARIDQLDQADKQFLALEGEVHYLPKDGGKLDATGAVRMLGRRFITNVGAFQLYLAPGPAPTGAAIVMKENDIKSLAGAIGVEIDDAQGPLLNVTVMGAWDAKTAVQGMASVKLAKGRKLAFPGPSGPRIEIAKAEGMATMSNSQLDSFTGATTVDVFDNAGKLFVVDGSGTFNAREGKLERAHGGVTLARPINIALGGHDDAVVIDSMAAEATIENGELNEASGQLGLKLPHLGDGGMSLSIEGGWERGKNGQKDKFWGRGTLEFKAIEDTAKGRKLGGSVGVDIGKDGKWTVNGRLDWQLTPDIGGDATLEMDENLDPVIGVSAHVAPFTLVEGRTLFERNLQVIPPIEIGGLVFATIGCTAGFGMRMEPLTARVNELSARGWRPFGNGKQTVPDFTASMSVGGGLDFWIKVAPYVTVGVGIPSLLNMQLGVEAGLQLDVPVHFDATAILRGGASGFSGELDLGVDIKPELSLKLVPFMTGEVLFFDLGRAKLAELDLDLGSPFELAWGGKYTFGDTEGRAPSSSPTPPGASEPKQERKRAMFPQAFPERAAAPPSAAPGRPKIGGNDKQEQSNAAGMGGGDGELGKILAAAEAIGGLGSALAAYEDAETPNIMREDFAFKYELKKIAWRNVALQGRKLYDVAVEMMPGLVYDIPLWVKLIIDNPYNPPGPMEAWAAEDDVARGKVMNIPEMMKLPPAGLVQLGKAMLRGSCGDEDEVSIYVMLKHAQSRGCLREVVDGLGGWDVLDHNYDGKERALLGEIAQAYLAAQED